MIQELLVIITIIYAIYFLIRTYLLPKKKQNKGCGGNNCECH